MGHPQLKATVRQLNQTKEKVVRKTKSAVRLVDKEAHKKPWKFVGVAALTSALLGFLLGRKSKYAPPRD